VISIYIINLHNKDFPVWILCWGTVVFSFTVVIYPSPISSIDSTSISKASDLCLDPHQLIKFDYREFLVQKKIDRVKFAPYLKSLLMWLHNFCQIGCKRQSGIIWIIQFLGIKKNTLSCQFSHFSNTFFLRAFWRPENPNTRVNKPVKPLKIDIKLNDLGRTNW